MTWPGGERNRNPARSERSEKHESLQTWRRLVVQVSVPRPADLRLSQDTLKDRSQGSGASSASETGGRHQRHFPPGANSAVWFGGCHLAREPEGTRRAEDSRTLQAGNSPPEARVWIDAPHGY